MLRQTVNSLRPQVDHIKVSLNGYLKVPDFLEKGEYIVLNNSMGDAAKHYFAEKCRGYILTCDDDLIYPRGYVDYMVKGADKYQCAVTLHGRSYPNRPIKGFQADFVGYPCLGDVLFDTEVDIAGDGVACWHTDVLKVKYSDFLQKNMSQLYFSKLCHEQNVKIMCLAHRTGYLGYMNPEDTIWDQSAREGFVKQTELLREFLK